MAKLTIVPNPRADILAGLRALFHDICPYIGCCNKANTVVTFAKRTSEYSFENSVVLCPQHAYQCETGTVSTNVIQSIRGLINPARVDNSHTINSREDYLSLVAEKIRVSHTVRVIYVGPLPFHPDWYFTLDEKENKVSMDRSMQEALKSHTVETAIILRNSPRYIEKVKALTPEDRKPELVDSIIENFVELSKPQYKNRILHFDTGFLHIPIIFDSSCIFTRRQNENSPINGGYYTEDANQVSFETTAFDDIVKEHADNSLSLNRLKRFLKQIL